eukprot:TRINITY_DN7414_c3_g2_i1.p1 TRINITY_DN7414_c3_g2~~TRINITY_DN7414_c3_g2_i1.p1  ORF type:complete len:158 (-),score=20.00 TRINITY_DN7414_c3_g2_i1:159-632(-)
MADVNSVFYTVEGDRLKLINKIILGLALFSSIWESDVTGSIALLGIMAVICGNLELLLAYIFLNPLSIIFDIIRLAIHANWFIIVLDILEMLMKLIGMWFAWSLWSNRDSGNYQSYTGNEGGMQSVGHQGGGGGGGDPFSSYPKPSNTNQDDGNAAL